MMKLNWNKIKTLFLLAWSTSLVFCLKIKIDRYKIVRHNQGIKKCAVIYGVKKAPGQYTAYSGTITLANNLQILIGHIITKLNDIVGLGVSNDIGKCDGFFSRRTAENQSMYDGYAEKILSVSIFNPAHVLGNKSHFVWRIPGGLVTGYELDVLFSLSSTSPFKLPMDTFALFLSREPLADLDSYYKRKTQTESVVFSTIFQIGFLHCYISGDVEEFSPMNLEKSKIANISVFLQEESVKMLLDGDEKCTLKLPDFGNHFQTFRLIYIYMDLGAMDIHTIQLRGNQ